MSTVAACLQGANPDLQYASLLPHLHRSTCSCLRCVREAVPTGLHIRRIRVGAVAERRGGGRQHDAALRQQLLQGARVRGLGPARPVLQQRRMALPLQLLLCI